MCVFVCEGQTLVMISISVTGRMLLTFSEENEDPEKIL